MRDSPWLAPSAWAPGRGSRPRTRCPRRARCAAVDEPKPPRPATTTSYVARLVTRGLLGDHAEPLAEGREELLVALPLDGGVRPAAPQPQEQLGRFAADDRVGGAGSARQVGRVGGEGLPPDVAAGADRHRPAAGRILADVVVLVAQEEVEHL